MRVRKEKGERWGSMMREEVKRKEVEWKGQRERAKEWTAALCPCGAVQATCFTGL